MLSSEHDWNPQHVCFPEATRTVEEEISRTIGSVQTYVDQTDIGDYATDREAVLYDIGERMIASVKVREVPRQVAQVEVQDVPQLKTFQSKGRHSSTSPEELSERWSIGLDQAKETLKRTSQRLVRSAVMPLARRYKADSMFEKKRLRGIWSTDTMDGRVKSIDGNRYAQVFANGGFFAEIYPMASKADETSSLSTDRKNRTCQVRSS